MLTDLFLQYYEADFFQGLFSINERKLANVFIPNFRYYVTAQFPIICISYIQVHIGVK